MRLRPLGQSGLHVSALGFGAASLWGMPFYDEAEAHRVLRSGLEAGMTYVDTGPTYSRGNAEPRLGRFLSTWPDRDRLVLSTKAGTRMGRFGRLAKDFSPAWIRASVEASLGRLGLERLPLLLLHGPRVEDMTPALLDALAALRHQGRVTAVGINSFDTEVLERIPDWPGISVALLDYNLLRLDREPLIDRLASAGIGILAGEPLAQHVFTARPLRLRSARDLWYLARALRRRPADLALSRRYAFMQGQPEGTPAQLALAFVLANRHVASAVFSTTRVGHLQENLCAADLALSDDLARKIKHAGLVHA